jgi:CelD/BcsL family acetyltransferase involved in cellulose biosynthesis
MWTVAEESLESLDALWRDAASNLDWDCLFVLPPWLRAWWSAFGAGVAPFLCSVRDGGEVIGVAPLIAEGGTARFLGSTDVCDYQDFVTAEGREGDFFRTLLAHLSALGISRLDLGALRPDSSAMRELPPVAAEAGWKVAFEPEDVAVELDLPATWEGYLGGLAKKERHELRRKLRRLEGAGEVTFRRSEGTEPDVAAFFELFRASRPEKAAFLVGRREAYFRALAENTAGAGFLNLRFLDLDGAPAAAVLCFDYRSTTYLYNSGFDPRLEHLSAGILSKSLSIRDSIRRGRSRYDFLKGAEAYKYRLGGREVPLSRCKLFAVGR